MKCKPGDLAIVIYAPWSPMLLGHIVEVIRGVQDEFFTMDGSLRIGHSWEVRYPDGRLILESRGKPPLHKHKLAPTRMFNDRCLRPLPPLSEDEHDQAEASKPGEFHGVVYKSRKPEKATT